jgi:hypothetical protein
MWRRHKLLRRIKRSRAAHRGKLRQRMLDQLAADILRRKGWSEEKIRLAFAQKLLNGKLV